MQAHLLHHIPIRHILLLIITLVRLHRLPVIMEPLWSMPLLLSFMAAGVIMEVPDITVDTVVIMEAMATTVAVVDIVVGITDA
jgi:hypothetical protein